jgi:hypothetical protein
LPLRILRLKPKKRQSSPGLQRLPIAALSNSQVAITLRRGIPFEAIIPSARYDVKPPNCLIPGFVEMDLVAHGGDSAHGEYLQTLNVVDIATRWSECLILANCSQRQVTAAMDRLRARLPFPLLGIDSDDDSAFINDNLYRYCQQEHITFTRSRPYKKNDQAHIEQKNWSVVRRLIGYDRYESAEEQALIEAIYQDWRLYVNFFQPVLKLVEKRRVDNKVRKRYDTARTPFQRVLDSPDVSEEDKERLRQIYALLNPVALRQRIDENLERLFEATLPPR